MSASSFRLSNPRRIGKGSLVGAFDLEMPSGLKINGVMMFEKDGGRWIGFPSKEWTKRDGTRGFSPFIEFASPEARERFQAQVLPLAESSLV
jgi:hypothetical protein